MVEALFIAKSSFFYLSVVVKLPEQLVSLRVPTASKERRPSTKGGNYSTAADAGLDCH
tara:strand:- start:996 stop:1169 length:174 start_codon:yes stop_codon:yes gene_type:complete